MSVAQKRHAIATVQEGSIMERCRALDLARSSFYYQPKGESALNLELMRLMDEEYTKHCFHGVIGMRDFLRLEKGYWVNEKRVRRLLRLMGLEAVAPAIRISSSGVSGSTVSPCCTCVQTAITSSIAPLQISSGGCPCCATTTDMRRR